jgi:starvation-inducible DNA-binding protein
MTSTTLQNPPPTATEMAPLAASALQTLLPDLVALALDAKQAHWNVTGPTFLPLHDLTDQLAADALAWADRVAERAVALGFAVDGRPGTVAAIARPFLLGRLDGREAIDELGGLLDDVVATARAALDVLARADEVGHNVVVSTLEGLEKYRWMLHAQAS